MSIRIVWLIFSANPEGNVIDNGHHNLHPIPIICEYVPYDTKDPDVVIKILNVETIMNYHGESSVLTGSLEEVVELE